MRRSTLSAAAALVLGMPSLGAALTPLFVATPTPMPRRRAARGQASINYQARVARSHRGKPAGYVKGPNRA